MYYYLILCFSSFLEESPTPSPSPTTQFLPCANFSRPPTPPCPSYDIGEDFYWVPVTFENNTYLRNGTRFSNPSQVVRFFDIVWYENGAMPLDVSFDIYNFRLGNASDLKSLVDSLQDDDYLCLVYVDELSCITRISLISQLNYDVTPFSDTFYYHVFTGTLLHRQDLSMVTIGLRTLSQQNVTFISTRSFFGSTVEADGDFRIDLSVNLPTSLFYFPVQDVLPPYSPSLLLSDDVSNDLPSSSGGYLHRIGRYIKDRLRKK